jgi:5-methylcytosine-specific restriction endonuclease McrA
MRNNGEWTEARWRSFVISALRAATRRYPPKYKTLKEAFVEKRINKKSGKLASFYTCASCKKEYVAKDVQVDHKVPVVGPEGFTTWDKYIEGMFCDVDNLQVLCTTCHTSKTKEENGLKRVSRQNVRNAATKRTKPALPDGGPVRRSRGSNKPVRKSSEGRS